MRVCAKATGSKVKGRQKDVFEVNLRRFSAQVTMLLSTAATRIVPG